METEPISLDIYLESTKTIEKYFMKQESLQDILNLFSFWDKDIFSYIKLYRETSEEIVSPLLATNTHSLYLSALKLTISGQSSSVYPILRVSYENAVYALMIHNNIELAEKYLNLALENDVPEAYTILADIYFNFKEDGAKAVEYLSKGAEANISTSQYALAVIYKNGLNSEAFSLEPNEFIASKYLTDACLNNKKTKKLEELCSSDVVIKEKIGE